MKGIFLIHIIQEDDTTTTIVREESGRGEEADSSPIFCWILMGFRIQIGIRKSVERWSSKKRAGIGSRQQQSTILSSKGKKDQRRSRKRKRE